MRMTEEGKKKEEDDDEDDERVPKKEMFLWTQFRAHAAAQRMGLSGDSAPMRYADPSALIALTTLACSLLRSQLGFKPTLFIRRRPQQLEELLPISAPSVNMPVSCCWCGKPIRLIRSSCPLHQLFPRPLLELPLDHAVAAEKDVAAEEMRPPFTTYMREMWYLCSRTCCREAEAAIRARFPDQYLDNILRHTFESRESDQQDTFSFDQFVKCSTGKYQQDHADKVADGRSERVMKAEKAERRAVRRDKRKPVDKGKETPPPTKRRKTTETEETARRREKRQIMRW